MTTDKMKKIVVKAVKNVEKLPEKISLKRKKGIMKERQLGQMCKHTTTHILWWETGSR